jgi:DNA-binding NtrC family response regulator
MANILIIDDQPYMGQLLEEELADERLRISHLEDADYLMSILDESRPDVVLLELYLQGVERWDLLDRIKKYDPSLPILIVSAYDNFVKSLHLHHVDGYLLKDIHIDDLKQKIYQSLAKPSPKSSAKKSRDYAEAYCNSTPHKQSRRVTLTRPVTGGRL